MRKGELFETIARHIDREIFTHYRLYPANYIAADLLGGTSRFASEYTEEEKKKFREYIASRLDKVDLPNKDEAFLHERILTMYANPALNHLKAMEEQ